MEIAGGGWMFGVDVGVVQVGVEVGGEVEGGGWRLGRRMEVGVEDG